MELTGNISKYTVYKIAKNRRVLDEKKESEDKKMKVKFEQKGKDKIIMTLSHGLQISMDRGEVLMVRDACNEFIEDTGDSVCAKHVPTSPGFKGLGGTVRSKLT